MSLPELTFRRVPVPEPAPRACPECKGWCCANGYSKHMKEPDAHDCDACDDGTARVKPKNVLLDGGATWVHPDAAWIALRKLMPPSHVEGFDADWFYLRAAVSLLDHIARHPAGTEAVVKQVRQYRRRLKGTKP